MSDIESMARALGEPVAGGGLLHRRAFLHGVVAFAAAVAAACARRNPSPPAEPG
jgi:hypothetical protein